jgi:hypothetical protein
LTCACARRRVTALKGRCGKRRTTFPCLAKAATHGPSANSALLRDSIRPMNKDQLKKQLHSRVRLSPRALRRNESGALFPFDDEWSVEEITDSCMKIRNTSVENTATLGLDQIRSFTSDPQRNTDGFEHGFLSLHVQITVLGRDVLIDLLDQASYRAISPHRPYISFDRWGQIPENHPEARIISPPLPYVHERIFLQNGFHLRHDGGGVAYQVEVNIGPFPNGEFTAMSKMVPVVGKEGGFALVWIVQPLPLQSRDSPGIWDLLGAMATSAGHLHALTTHRPDFALPVRMTYRDVEDMWYQSQAQLSYIRSQRRLEFGPMSHLRGSSTRPAA